MSTDINTTAPDAKPIAQQADLDRAITNLANVNHEAAVTLLAKYGAKRTPGVKPEDRSVVIQEADGERWKLEEAAREAAWKQFEREVPNYAEQCEAVLKAFPQDVADIHVMCDLGPTPYVDLEHADGITTLWHPLRLSYDEKSFAWLSGDGLTKEIARQALPRLRRTASRMRIAEAAAVAVLPRLVDPGSRAKASAEDVTKEAVRYGCALAERLNEVATLPMDLEQGGRIGAGP